MRRVAARSLKKLPLSIQKLYEDSCVRRGAIYLCPVNFSELTVSWYVNHSDTPKHRTRSGSAVQGRAAD